jgi:hypothetical protein
MILCLHPQTRIAGNFKGLHAAPSFNSLLQPLPYYRPVRKPHDRLLLPQSGFLTAFFDIEDKKEQ